MRWKRGDCAPDQDPNASTLSFDAFTPAPHAAEPTEPAAPDSSAEFPGPAGTTSLNPGPGPGPGPGPDPRLPGGSEPPYFAYPPSMDPVEPTRSKRPEFRSVVILAGVVLLVCGIGAGAYAALSSSSPASSNQSASAAGAPAPGATTAAHRGHGRVETARVTITAVNGNTLTGTTASGAGITIDITSDTKLGTRARPITLDQLAAGDVVIVRGQRASAGTYTALGIALVPNAGTAPTSTSTTSTTPTTPAGPIA